MNLPVQVTFHGQGRSEAVETAVHEKVHHLERFCSDIVSCRVTVELLQKHQRHGRHIGVRIDATIPGHEIVVNRVENEDVYVALRDAFDDMKRRLEEAIQRRREQRAA